MARERPQQALALTASGLAVIGCSAWGKAFTVAPRGLVASTAPTQAGPVADALGSPVAAGQASSPVAIGGHAALLAVVATSVAGHNRLRQRSGRVKRHGRVITVEVENDVHLALNPGCVATMDAFMADNATEVSLQNLQRMEDMDGQPGVKLCYLEPSDFGPFRSQMRLTVDVQLPCSGRCDVNILNMENGTVDKKTGDVEWPDPKEAAKNFKFETANYMTWKETEKGLEVVNTCTAKSESILPSWFPLPDALMKALSSAFVRRIISTGQEEVMVQMKKQYTKWRAEQKLA